jgi:hypothetical protein
MSLCLGVWTLCFGMVWCSVWCVVCGHAADYRICTAATAVLGCKDGRSHSDLGKL